MSELAGIVCAIVFALVIGVFIFKYFFGGR